MRKNGFSFLVVAFVSVLFLTSCATTVSRKVLRPAELDLNGARTISVLPFDISDNSYSGHSLLWFFTIERRDPEEEELARMIQDNIINDIVEYGYFTVISGKQVQVALEKGTTIPCDVYIAGSIVGYNVDVKIKDSGRKDKYGYTVYEHTKNVSFTLVYEVVDARTGSVYYRFSENYSGSDYASTEKDLDSVAQIMKYRLDGCTSNLMKKLQPYETTIYLKLLEDKSKNPDMESANKLASKGQYEAARTLFRKVYSDTGLFEAAYNEAILVEAMGKLEEARELMDALYRETYDSRAAKEVENIDREIRYSERLGQQIAARQ